MFKSLKQGLKKLIPGQSETARHPAQHPMQRRAAPAATGSQTQGTTSSLPDSYLDADSMFK